MSDMVLASRVDDDAVDHDGQIGDLVGKEK